MLRLECGSYLPFFLNPARPPQASPRVRVPAVESGCRERGDCPTVVGMRTGYALVTATLLLALAGCVPADLHGSPSPHASATPVFASDAEALAAAEKAYAAYLKVSDEIANDGGKDSERLEVLATGSLLSDDLAGFESFAAKRWHSVGATKLTRAVLQSVDRAPDGKATIIVYLCEDVSGVDVVDENGRSVISSGRPNLQQFQVQFETVRSKLIPSEREPWTGSPICN